MTNTILRAWQVSPAIEVRLVENGAWNQDTANSEFRYRVVTATVGAEVDEDVFDELEDAAREARIRARVLREDLED
jgi:hypothetical protein